jgi:hypothetical protein
MANKPLALSLHIGLNSVDPAHYSGWSGPLTACEFDANDMRALAISRKISPTSLLTKNATRSQVLGALQDSAKKLAANDFFFLSYSGHGGQMPDLNADESDGRDETWCLYDGQLIDDELYAELLKFKPGVRIVVLSDSCHSGTVLKLGPPSMDQFGVAEAPSGVRAMPDSVGMRVFEQHRDFYAQLQQHIAEGLRAPEPGEAASISPRQAGRRTLMTRALAQQAPAVLISGCQDNQTSMDGPHNGAFTGRLLKVWNGGKFKGNYAQLCKTIVKGMPDTQTPNLYTVGPAARLVAQQAFAI